MDSFVSWIGGKKSSREIICARFPVTVPPRYIEVFGGGGWVLFHKHSSPFEVYNDYNPNLTNLFHCVKYKKQELLDELRYSINSRLEFNRMKKIIDEPTEIGDVVRAAEFYQVIKYSYANKCTSYSCQPHSIWNNFPLIDQCSARLQKVNVENRHYETLISQCDAKNSFFYCDPPYFNTENYYKNVGFTSDDHQRLHDLLVNIKGKFLLSYNDCPEIRELYDNQDLFFYSYQRVNNMALRYSSGEVFNELLIANYDMEKARITNQPQQITFFMEDYEDGDFI